MTDHDDPAPEGTPTTAPDLEAKLDTVAGAVAAVAASQNDLLAHLAEVEARRHQDAQETAQRLDAIERQLLASAPPDGSDGPDLAAALERIAESVERLDSRTDDRLAAVRDAALTPVTDLQELLRARAAKEESDLAELAAAVEGLASSGPLAVREQLAELVEAVAGLAEHRTPDATGPILERIEELASAITAVTWQLPELATELAAVRERLENPEPPAPSDDPDLAEQVNEHTDSALVGVLRLIDERLTEVRAALAEVSTSSDGEVSAVMGLAQLTSDRLEQRLDAEFEELGQQLQAMAALLEQVAAEAEANRPVVSGEQLRRAASVVRETVVGASRSRRDRRGGPKTPGPT